MSFWCLPISQRRRKSNTTQKELKQFVNRARWGASSFLYSTLFILFWCVCVRTHVCIPPKPSWRFPKRLPRWRLNSENWLSWGCHGWSLTAVRPDSFWTILSTEWKSPSPWAAPSCCCSPGALPPVSTADVWWCESHSRDSLAVQVLSFCSDGKTLWKLCELFLETRFNFSRFVGTEVVRYVFKY